MQCSPGSWPFPPALSVSLLFSLRFSSFFPFFQGPFSPPPFSSLPSLSFPFPDPPRYSSIQLTVGQTWQTHLASLLFSLFFFVFRLLGVLSIKNLSKTSCSDSRLSSFRLSQDKYRLLEHSWRTPASTPGTPCVDFSVALQIRISEAVQFSLLWSFLVLS